MDDAIEDIGSEVHNWLIRLVKSYKTICIIPSLEEYNTDHLV